MSEASGLAEMLRDLVDTLIPGHGPWPAASVVGVQGVLGMRLLETRGERCLDELAKVLAEAGGPLAGKDEAGRIAVVQRFEQQAESLFTLVRTATYFAYYEHPAVVRQVQALGQPYHAIPYKRGYAIEPFDLDRDRPSHGRGYYVPTEAVKRVDLSPVQGS